MFAAFGIDGFPSDQPRDDAVRRLLETELPPEAEPEIRAPPPANARRYVPQHAEAASTPKRPAYDDTARAAEHREARSPFGAFGDDDDDEDGLSRFASTSPRSRGARAAPYAREAFERGGGSFDPSRNAHRLARSASAEPRTAAAAARYAERYAARMRPASASTSTSPSRARPAWGGGGGSRRLEDSESPGFGSGIGRRGWTRASSTSTSRSMDAPLSEKERARVAANRARAELATVERLRLARELRESKRSAPGGFASARRFSSQTALAFGSSAPVSSRFRDEHGGASLRSSSPAYVSGAFARNAGDRLYRRGVFEREKRERERARELERIAAEAIGEVAISRDFAGGMGGVESSRPFGMTNVSRALMTDARAFESRQRMFEAKKAESIELERLRAFTRGLEETSAQGRPRITASASAMTRTVGDLSAWQKRREARLEQARRDLEADESRELTFAPATDFSRSAAAATRPIRVRREPGTWSPPKSPPRASATAKRSSAAPRGAQRGAAGRAFAGGKEDAAVRAAGTAAPSAPAATETPGTPAGVAERSAPAPADNSRPLQSHVGPYSPKAHEREMARALAAAALAGAAAMAQAATTPSAAAAANPSTAPPSVSSPPANAFGLTQVTRSETHDTSPSRVRSVPGTGRFPDAADEATPSPDPRAATSLRNSVNFDAPAAGAAATRRIPVATTRATELRDAARRLALEEAAAKEAFRPRITARARALHRSGDFGERLYENASAKKKTNTKQNGIPKTESPATARRAGDGGVSRSSAPSAFAMPSVAGALARQKEKAREERRASAARAGRASAPGADSGRWGKYGDQPEPAWGAYGSDAAPPPAQRRLDLRGGPSSARARDDEGPPDRGAARSVREAEARAREAWGYYE